MKWRYLLYGVVKKLLKKYGVSTELIAAILGETKNITYIPKERFDEVNNSLKELKGQLKAMKIKMRDGEYSEWSNTVGSIN